MSDYQAYHIFSGLRLQDIKKCLILNNNTACKRSNRQKLIKLSKYQYTESWYNTTLWLIRRFNLIDIASPSNNEY